MSPSHQHAFSSIFWGIQQRKGLVAVTGEAGVGKTTILRSYLGGVNPERIRTVYILHAALSFGELMEQIVSELGISAVDKDLPDLIDKVFLYLIEEYKNDRRVVLIIDEAQNLPVETLERLLMLSNMETSQEKLLQIILVGQLEFENKLNLPELKELKDRITVRCRIDTLRSAESLACIEHRLRKASLSHNPVFTKRALKRIVKASNGIPRVINILCDNALISAFGHQRNPVDDEILKEVILNFRGGQPGGSFRWRFVLVPALVVFSGLVVLASTTLLTHKEIQPVGAGIITAKIPAPPPVAEIVEEYEVKPPVESGAKAEPEPSTPEAPATRSDKSVPETLPSASVQLEIPRETQTPVAEKAPVPNDVGALAVPGSGDGAKENTFQARKIRPDSTKEKSNERYEELVDHVLRQKSMNSQKAIRDLSEIPLKNSTVVHK
ncbi:MAG: AAA family ATPase [Syntrophobacteraceae bacterium]